MKELLQLFSSFESFKLTRKGDNKNLAIFEKYKYSLTAENSPNVPGYMTEKILSPFVANSVPIYFGSDHILKLFNAKSFYYMSSLR
jgi:hypothetical protein